MKSLFKKDVAIQALLYIVNRIGERKDFHKIFKTLYFADQRHLSRYARSITGDRYIAMDYGPVPSNIDDILKALRGDSFFSFYAQEFKPLLTVKNKYLLEAKVDADLDYLSETDIECLDEAIAECKDKSFDDLVKMSHGDAWLDTAKNGHIEVNKILMEFGDNEEYADFIKNKLMEEACF